LHISTPLVYKNLGAPMSDGKSGLRSLTDLRSHVNSVLHKLNDGVPVNVGLRNDLSSAARKVEPRLLVLQAVLQTMYPERWLMSGSGAVHFVVAAKNDDGSALRQALATEIGSSTRVLTATTFTP
jgi:4-diphosphocytidyl-2C-methyl-D-erythritol kinase